MKLLILLCFLGLAAAAVFQHQLIRIESRKSKMIKAGLFCLKVHRIGPGQDNILGRQCFDFLLW